MLASKTRYVKQFIMNIFICLLHRSFVHCILREKLQRQFDNFSNISATAAAGERKETLSSRKKNPHPSHASFNKHLLRKLKTFVSMFVLDASCFQSG